MSWIRLGLVFKPNQEKSWSVSHATAPTPIQLSDKCWRVFFSSRDKENRSHVGWFDINLDDPNTAIRSSEKPLLSPGPIGHFDGNGIYATSAVKIGESSIRLYTIGWNPGHRKPLFYASIGVAESDDMGLSIRWRSSEPVLDRSRYDPTSVTGPWVMLDNDHFKMWYVSGLRWIESEEQLKSVYHVKYAESKDGLNWMRAGVVAIDFNDAQELNIARPCVLRGLRGYEAWFSSSKGEGYRIGHAVSDDGQVFTRLNESSLGLLPSESYFEDQAVCHPAVVVHKGKRFMFYNGNQFGHDGIALAIEA